MSDKKYIVDAATDAKYSKNNYRFPDYKIDPKNKVAEYCRQVCESIFSIHIQGKSGVPYSRGTQYDENRMYGNSAQPVSKYKVVLMGHNEVEHTNNMFDTLDDDGAISGKKIKREGWMNVLWKPLDVVSKLKYGLHGMYDKADFDIVAKGIDQKSGAKREQMKYMSQVHQKWGQDIQMLSNLIGIEYVPPTYVPENEYELSMFENAGGFKLLDEIANEELIQHTFDISDYENTLKIKWIEDFFCNNIIAAKQYYDENECKLKWRYVDPDPYVSIIQYSKHWNFKDAEYGGEVIWHKVSYLRGKIYPDDPEKEYEVLKKCATQFATINNYTGNLDYNAPNVGSRWLFDDFRLPVLETNWIDQDSEKKLIFITLDGTVKRVKPLEWDKVPTKRQLRDAKGKYDDDVKEVKLQETNALRLYKCSLILGTDIVFNYGLEEGQSYPPRLPFVFRKYPGIPIVEQIIPHIDQVNLAWFKFQNALAQMQLDTTWINQDMLDNLSLAGGEVLDVADQMEMVRQTGIGVFRSLKFDAGGNSFSSAPTHKEEGGMGKAFQELTQAINYSLLQIEQTTGINQVLLGGQAPSRQPGKTTEAAITGSLNVTKPIIDTIMMLKQDMAEVTCDTLNALFKVDQDAQEAYRDVIGDAKIEALKIAAKNSKYGIKMEAQPTSQDWDNLNQKVNLVLQQSGLEFISPAIMIDQLRLSRYNLKQMHMLVRSEVDKMLAKKKQDQIDAIKQQSDGNLQLQKAKDESADKDANRQMMLNNNDWQNKHAQEGIRQQGKKEGMVLEKQLNQE
jgi:hypothetical protein